MKRWNFIVNLIIPILYSWIATLLFSDDEKGRFFPYIVTLLMFSFHVASIFIFSKIKKKTNKWTFINFVLLMIALGVNIFIFEQFLYKS